MTNIDEQKFAINIPRQAKVLTKNCYGISQNDMELIICQEK